MLANRVTQPHLFPAHRVYIWAYEKALREECGYKGWQPVCLVTSPNLSKSDCLTSQLVLELGPHSRGPDQLATLQRQHV
jgi:hypothetical protein